MGLSVADVSLWLPATERVSLSKIPADKLFKSSQTENFREMVCNFSVLKQWLGPVVGTAGLRNLTKITLKTYHLHIAVDIILFVNSFQGQNVTSEH